MNEYIFLIIIVFILGTCLGSFLSVLVNRTLQAKKGIIAGHSECPQCHHQLGILNLIPILSWVFQRGKCTFCHKAISPEYPILEFISGVLTLTAFVSIQSDQFSFSELNSLSGGWPYTIMFWLKFIFLILINSTLLAITFSDIKKRQIPNLFLIFWITICIPAFFLASQSFASIGIALATNLLFFGGQFLLSKGRWLGSGDVFLSFGMALLLGWQKNLVAIFSAYVIGSVISIILMLNKKAKKNSQIAFGPFLALGTLIALYFGNEIILWYIGSNTF